MPDEPKAAGFLNIVPSADELQAAGIAIVERFVTALDGALNATIADLDGWDVVLDLQLGGIPLRGRIKLVAPASGKPHP